MTVAERMSDLVPAGSRLEMHVDGTPFFDAPWEDIAHALGACSSEGAELLRFMYAGEAHSGRAVMGRLQGYLLGFELEGQMRLTVADLALRVYVAPPLCQGCAGHGFYMRGPQVVSCAACGGTGMLSASDSRLAGALGLTLGEYHRIAQRPFDGALSVLRRWHDTAIMAASRALADEAPV